MTIEEITDLRAWAAGVCRYTKDGWYYKRDGRPAWTDQELRTHAPIDRGNGVWQPDQNIAQAIEVLDAVMATIPREKYPLILDIRFVKMPESEHHSCVIRWLGNSRDANHESRCISILLACRKALEQLQ